MCDKEKNGRIIYYSCGHSSEGEALNLEEQNQAEILEMIEKGVVLASSGVCPDCLDKDKQTIKIYQQSGILPE